MSKRKITLYIDYKSPYAYLAVRPANALEIEYDVELDWLPYILDIPEYLGSVEGRNEHQWRRVRYSYMDARRLANRIGLTVRGPKKIFDSRIAAMGMLYAKQQGVFAPYNALVFECFWKRELDIEDAGAVAGALRAAGAEITGFENYCASEGPKELQAVMDAAHELDVFGVPSFVLDGEVFWGGDRIDLLRERLHTSS